MSTAKADSMKPSPPGGSARRIWIWVRRILATAGALAGALLLAAVALLHHYGADLPSTAELRSYHPQQVTRILARDGTVIGELFVERRTIVPIGEIPNRMKLAALAAEDASFYEHAGLNYLGMFRALVKDVTGRTRQGGSTITQQVVKNVLLSPERTLSRKVREAILARRIEAELTKDEILELYLNQIYFGHGRYGVEEAARYYFGKSVRDVSLAEAAMLAGIIKGPEIYAPRGDGARARSRQAFVLDQMAKKSFATAEQAAAATAERVQIASPSGDRSELAPEVVDEVKRVLHSLVGAEADRGGYTITTTIDPALQEAARSAVRRNVDDYEKRHRLVAPLVKAKHEPAPFTGVPPSGRHALLGVVTGVDDARNTLTVRVGTLEGTVDLADSPRDNPQGMKPSEFTSLGKVVRVVLRNSAHIEADAGVEEERDSAKMRLELGPESALVALDVRSREVLALIGSYEGVRGGIDRTQAHRQPGSTFKAFVYGYAIHTRTKEWTPATIVETNPFALRGYRPDNFDEGEGQRARRLRDAFALSINTAAVWSLERLGPTNVTAWAKTLGVSSKLGADLSVALGSYEITPRELASAYATFAAGGMYSEPVLIRKITGPSGAEVPLPARAPDRRVMDEAEAYVLTSLLTSVVHDGTAKRARQLGRPVAGKTGTSNQAKDGWFVGYTTDVACAVWTGYDDPTPMGSGEAGATVALPAFIDFMREAHKHRAPGEFPVPSGVTRVMIDPATGLRAYPDEKDAMEEVFVSGTEPTDVSDAGAPDASAPDAAAPSEDAPRPPQAEDVDSGIVRLPEPPPF